MFEGFPPGIRTACARQGSGSWDFMWHSARHLPDSTAFISPCQPSVPFSISRSREPSSPELHLCRDGGGSGQPKTGHQRPALRVAEDHGGFGSERPGLTRAPLPSSSPQLSWLFPQTTASPSLAGRPELVRPCSLGDLWLLLLSQHRGYHHPFC